MWRKQEEEEEERERDDFDEYFEGSKTKTCFQYEESLSWEEQAFAEDAGRLGACVWPPTSYSCSFCRREFRSAQALGGHMNVHRRDRARLNQSPNNNNNPNFTTTLSSSSSPSHHHLSTSPNYHLPNPNPSPPNDGRSDPKAEKDEELRNSCSRVRDKQHVENGVLDEGLNLGFGRSRPTTGLFCEDDEDAGAVTGCKRRKTESSIQFYVKSSSLVENQHHHHIQSEVIELSSTSLHDLDLELRLGGLSKG